MKVRSTMNNNEVKECAIELKYAPRKCEYFCMGDCCLPDTNRSCGTDKDNCEYYNLYAQLLQLKVDNEQLTQKLEKAKGEFNNIMFVASDTNTYYIAQQALKELE